MGDAVIASEFVLCACLAVLQMCIFDQVEPMKLSLLLSFLLLVSHDHHIRYNCISSIQSCSDATVCVFVNVIVFVSASDCE